MDYKIKNRATVRQYSSQEIDKLLLNSLLEEASRASTTGNMQLYSVVATSDQKMKEKLAPTHFNQPMVTQAPLVLTFCADFNRFTKWCEASGANPGYANFHSFMTAAIDAIIFAQTFAVVAESKGLGICYLGTATYSAEKIAEILELPRLVVPVATITVGYPAEPIVQIEDRIPVEMLLHEEVYQERSPEEILKILSYKETIARNKDFISENGKKMLAEVFTDVRYTKEVNEMVSKSYAAFIEKQGFEYFNK